MRFRLFLIHSCSIGLAIFLGGCALLSEMWPQSQQQIKKVNAINYYSGGTSGFVGKPAAISKKFENQQAPNLSVPEWYKMYCKEGKPVRKYVYIVSAVVPEPPPGFVATQASQYRTAWKTALDRTVPLLFLAGSTIPETRNPHPGERPQSKVISIRSKEEHAIFEDYATYAYQKTPQMPDVSESSPVMFLKASKDEKLYLVPRFALFLTNEFAVGVAIGNKIASIQVPKVRNSKLPPLYVAQDEFSVRLVSKNSSQISEMSPLSIAYLEDMFLMSDKFVILIPPAEQARYDITPYDPTDLKNVVENRHKIFEQILKKFTTVKAEQSENPNVITYEISLDYGLFCAYGRPLQDFISN